MSGADKTRREASGHAGEAGMAFLRHRKRCRGRHVLMVGADKRRLDALGDIRRVFEAFRGGDARALFEVIADDAVWEVPGTVPVARTYRGRDEIFELFRSTRRLTDGTYSSELRWCLADGEHAVAVYRATGRRLGRELDIEQVLLITLQDGRWQHVLALPTDPAAFDAFWA